MHADPPSVVASSSDERPTRHTPESPTPAGSTGSGATRAGATPDRPAADLAKAALAGLASEPGVAKPDPILVADGVTRSFGGLTAVNVGHVEIQRGSITALIGPNGAGKTTFFNLLTGFDKPDAGAWTFNGKPLQGVAAHKVARRGMVRTFQLTKALSRLSVMDNMRLGATGQRGETFWRALIPGMWRNQEREITERADALLEQFKLDAKREDFAGSLSGGQRKLLEMARALMVAPEMVMLDEPMAGVNPALTQSLLGHVKALREAGMTVLFVEHDMDMVRDISDWVIVMAQGKIIAEGVPDSVMADPRVIDAYLGAHHDGAVATVDGADVEPDDVGPAAGAVPDVATPRGAAAEHAATVAGGPAASAPTGGRSKGIPGDVAPRDHDPVVEADQSGEKEGL